MIKLIYGKPGGGKTYTALKEEVIPQLLLGRKVITNVPISDENKKNIAKDFPDIDISLLVTKVDSSGSPYHAFKTADDFKDDWKHPEFGFGPYFIIDECHILLNKNGDRDNLNSIDEFFALHRQYGFEIVLITQTPNVMDRSIRDKIELIIEVAGLGKRGLKGKYIRFEKTDFRRSKESLVDETVLKYDVKYFNYYDSFFLVKGNGSKNIISTGSSKSIFKTRFFITAVIVIIIMFFIFVYAVANFKNPFAVKELTVSQNSTSQLNSSDSSSATSTSTSTAKTKSKTKIEEVVEIDYEKYFLDKYYLVNSGYIGKFPEGKFVFKVFEKNNELFTIMSNDLINFGYSVRYINENIAQVTFNNKKFNLIFDKKKVENSTKKSSLLPI